MDSRIGRRDFLKVGLAGLATSAIGIGMTRRGLVPAAAPATTSTAADPARHKWAMVIDESKCVGCDKCLQACHAYNDTPPDISWSRVETTGVKADGMPSYRPVPCMHCQHPPCVEICPVGASYHREDGIVMMDYDRCIGCRYCQLACPYGARSFNWDGFDGPNPAVPTYGQPEIPRRPRGVVEKCSFCSHRIDRGLAFGMMPGVDAAATPACVVACTYGARIFGDLNDPDSPVSVALREHPEAYRLREELGTEPRVYYIPALPEEESVS